MNETHQACNDQVTSWSYIKNENKIVINSIRISSIEELKEENLTELKTAFETLYPNMLFPTIIQVNHNPND